MKTESYPWGGIYGTTIIAETEEDELLLKSLAEKLKIEKKEFDLSSIKPYSLDLWKLLEAVGFDCYNGKVLGFFMEE